ncbi:hypothetical protein TVAG_065530 [Trichomonas vaginalis G3]|uniref:Uncharacterized protein n=1 Tax=Trichomonas vaginalis (strain ATCC PRA-98 / G3) TaxID=412133 RepID=A2GLG8_TRIV3|nr:hypothetical protein TVAG_065530 [Trichomonas vaginalis G3]|eukprot:XP_001294929.1 hypothetical protein [Trichomonas vaginalis G3]
MSGSLSNKIDVSKFLAQMSNPDEDFAVIELDKLIKLLEKPPHEIFVTPNCDEWFLENILSRVYSKKIDLIDASFRSIVLLSQYYNVDKIRIIFRRILAISQENADIRPQLLSVLKEIFSNHSSYENSRNEEIFTYFFGECVRDLTLLLDDNLTFTIELLSSLIENLGSLATEKQLTELIDKVLFFLKPERNKEIKQQMRSFSNLVKEWSKFAPQALIERLVEYLLSENMKTTHISLTMLTSIVMTIQKPLLKFFDQLFDLFYENSQIETESDNDNVEDENTEIEDETESGIIVDSESIKKVQFSVEALANLTHAFPQESSKELSKLFDIFYSHVNYNIVESDSVHTDDEDAGMKLDIDSDMEDSDNEMMDDDAGFDDEESWKIRKSAVRLGMVLVNTFPTEFFESLQNEENEHHFTLSLDDTDPGAKKDILELLTKIVKTYGNKISKANEWITIVSNSVKQTDQNCISCIVAISELTKIYRRYRKSTRPERFFRVSTAQFRDFN